MNQQLLVMGGGIILKWRPLFELGNQWWYRSTFRLRIHYWYCFSYEPMVNGGDSMVIAICHDCDMPWLRHAISARIRRYGFNKRANQFTTDHSSWVAYSIDHEIGLFFDSFCEFGFALSKPISTHWVRRSQVERKSFTTFIWVEGRFGAATGGSQSGSWSQ